MDSSIVTRTKNGEVAAFTELYNFTHDKAFSVAYSILKDDFDAEDIVQEAYIVVMEKLDDLKNPDRFESWFYQIVRTRSLNELKKKRPTTFTNLESLDSPEYQFVDTVESDYKPFNPEAVVDEAETRRLVRDMVFSLPEMQKKCIIMRYQGDMKVCDIAKALNIPESTVKSNLNYGRKKIEESVRNMERKGVKLYSVSPTLVLPLLREVLYMGIGAAVGGERNDDNSKGGSVLAEAGKEGVRVIVRRVVAGLCATFAIGGATIGLNSRQPAPAPEPTAVVTEAATELTEPVTEPPQQSLPVEELVGVWKEGSYISDTPNTYRLPKLTLRKGSASAFQKWVENKYELIELNLENELQYIREYDQSAEELHFDYVAEKFGNVLTVTLTENGFPSLFFHEPSISYDLSTGKKLSLEQLANYAHVSMDYIEREISDAIQEHWDWEDSYYGSVENIEQVRSKISVPDLLREVDIHIIVRCETPGYSNRNHGDVSLLIPLNYYIDSSGKTPVVKNYATGTEIGCHLSISALDFDQE